MTLWIDGNGQGYISREVINPEDEKGLFWQWDPDDTVIFSTPGPGVVTGDVQIVEFLGKRWIRVEVTWNASTPNAESILYITPVGLVVPSDDYRVEAEFLSDLTAATDHPLGMGLGVRVVPTVSGYIRTFAQSPSGPNTDHITGHYGSLRNFTSNYRSVPAEKVAGTADFRFEPGEASYLSIGCMGGGANDDALGSNVVLQTTNIGTTFTVDSDTSNLSRARGNPAIIAYNGSVSHAGTARFYVRNWRAYAL